MAGLYKVSVKSEHSNRRETRWTCGFLPEGHQGKGVFQAPNRWQKGEWEAVNGKTQKLKNLLLGKHRPQTPLFQGLLINA